MPTPNTGSRQRKAAKPKIGVGKAKRVTTDRRRTGRPSANDENVGPQKLVDTTRTLLQTIPPTRLTAGHVAKAAGVHRALIRYYFGSMSNLLAEVAAQLSHDLVATLAEASKGDDSAVDRLRRRVREFIRYELANPALHPLYAQQILSGKAPGAQRTLKSVAAEGHATLRQIVMDGRRSGEFREDFDVRYLDFAIICLCEFIVVGRPFLEAWTTSEERPSTMLQQYSEFIVELLLRGIASDQSPRGTR